MVLETKRAKIRESGTPGTKTPLVMKTVFHEDLEEFFVSDTSGNLIHRPNAEGGVPSALFPLAIDDEDAYQAIIADRLFTRGCSEGWGNVILTEEFTDEDFGDYLTFFEDYELVFAQVFCGLKGYEALRRSNRMIHPSKNTPLSEPLTLPEIQSLQEDYMVAGYLHHRPVFFNPTLGPYVIFSAPPPAVGLVTRMGDYASVVIHNPERGVIVARISDDFEMPELDKDSDTDDTTNEED